MLSLERLRTLVEVAERGSINAAAQSLHITQSAASQQLAKFAKEVGSDLLAPAGRGVVLTETGRLLVSGGKAVLAMMADLENDVAALNRQVVGELRIGTFASVARVVVPDALADLCALHPDLTVQVIVGEPERLTGPLVSRELDLIVDESWTTLRRPLPGDLVSTLLYVDREDVALPAGHPLAQRDSVALNELTAMPWATWHRDCAHHTWMIQTLREHGVEPDIRFEVPDFGAQLEFVARGLAAALVPRLARIWAPDGVALVPVRPTLHRQIYAVHRRDNARPNVRAGIAALQRAFERHATVPR